MIKRILILMAILLFIVVNQFYGAVTKFLGDNSIRDFEKGKFKNTTLDKDGFISLSPTIKELFSKEDIIFVWDAVEDKQNNIYFGTGNKPRIYKYSNKKKLKLFYEANNGVSIISLAVDSKNNIYAAVIPGSTIIKISPSGSAKVLARLTESYIWKLKLDSKDQLYVATGNPAKIYKITNSRKRTILYSSKKESHFLAMDMDSKENIYFASTDKGILYKYNKKSSNVSVLHDSYENEIKAIVVDKKDNIYFATATKVKKYPPNNFDYTDTFVLYGSHTKQRISSKKPPLKNSIYKISPKGDIKKVFTKDNTTFLSLAIDNKNQLYAGSGNSGVIYLIRGINNASTFIDTDELQITSLLVNKNNNLIVTTGNIAKVFELNLRSAFTGTYYSRIFTTRGPSIWGNISWKTNSNNGKVYLYTRTGKTITPDKTWSNWSKKYINPNGELIKNPKGNYIQYKAVMTSLSDKKVPVLKKVSMSYLLDNRPPELENIRLKQDINKSLPSKLLTSTIPPSVYTISWTAFDQDNDFMTYSIFFRRERSNSWILIKKDIIKKKYSFDSRRLPDGEFFVKVTASDKWSNGEKRAKISEKVSKLFTIDNTPPTIAEIKTNTIGDNHIISGIAIDNSSFIKVIEYSINSSDWKYLNPKDMIYDSSKEGFQLIITSKSELINGENIIIFRVADSFGNFSSKQVTFTINSKSYSSPEHNY